MNVLLGHQVYIEKPDRKKAKQIVHNNKQIKGLNYDDVYTITVKSSSIRILLALTALEDLKTRALDVIDTFLNIELVQEVYIHYLTGYKEKGTVYLILKALFGLY